MPPELNGLDLNPETIENEENEDLEEGQRIIIVYHKNEEQAVAKLLGLEKIEKITYQYNELKKDA